MNFDELNTLKTEIRKEIPKTIKDDYLDILIMAYMVGVNEVNEALGVDVLPSYKEMKNQFTKKTMAKTLFKEPKNTLIIPKILSGQ